MHVVCPFTINVYQNLTSSTSIFSNISNIAQPKKYCPRTKGWFALWVLPKLTVLFDPSDMLAKLTSLFDPLAPDTCKFAGPVLATWSQSN